MATRRAVIGGAAATAVSGFIGWGRALAAVGSDKPLFANTPLASNPVAVHFRAVDGLKLPPVPVVTAAGTASLSGVGGKTRLLALWAEWCTPCLIEIRDFAALRPGVMGDRFDIGLLLTASHAKLDREGALAKLRQLGAAAMPLLVEPDGGRRAAEALANRTGTAPCPPGAKCSAFSLPCTLLVDAQGRVRGRAFGSAMLGADGAIVRPVLSEEQKAALKRGEKVIGTPLTDADKAQLLASGKTVWAGQDGQAFLQALAGGALERI